MKSDKQKIRIEKKAINQQLHGSEQSLLKRYAHKAVGKANLSSLAAYEVIQFIAGNMSGTPGYGLRKFLFPLLFRSSGKGVIFGKGLTLRHPGKISLGNHVAIDDYVMLDGSGAGEEGITVGDHVIISRNCVIQGKTGPVVLGKRTDIGCNTILSSVGGICIGESVLIAGNCYIGGARYYYNQIDIPMMDQGIYSEGDIIIGEDVWLGANVTVLDGVSIARGCIVGAGSVVTSALPEYSIAVGSPARIIKTRKP